MPECSVTEAELLYCCKCATRCQMVSVGGFARQQCPACGYIYYRNPSPAISVLVADGDRYLLGKRSAESIYPDRWCLPCGYIEHEESWYDAAVREVQEETGIRVEPQRLINVVTNHLREDVHSLVVVVLAEPVTRKLIPGDDIVEADWFQIGQEPPSLAFDADVFSIRRHRENLAAGRAYGLPLEECETFFAQP